MITPDRLEAFSRLMPDKLDAGDTQARRDYLRSVISQIEVDDDRIRMIRERAILWLPSSQVNKPTPQMFVVLYGNGAPEEIRTPDPQIRSLILSNSLTFLDFP